MQWDGEGLIIGVRRHGESSVIADVMVAGRGRHLGLIRGGRSTRLAATLQPGNTVQVTWRARLEQHLGTFQIELLEARAAALIADRLRLYASQLVCEHLHLLPERDPHDRLLALALRIMDEQGTPLQLGAAVARYELVLLEELGFGLDLASCAATGVTTNLTHVSPRTAPSAARRRSHTSAACCASRRSWSDRAKPPRKMWWMRSGSPGTSLTCMCGCRGRSSRRPSAIRSSRWSASGATRAFYCLPETMLLSLCVGAAECLAAMTAAQFGR